MFAVSANLMNRRASTPVISNDSGTMSTTVEWNATAHEYSNMAQVGDTEMKIAKRSSGNNYQMCEAKASASHTKKVAEQKNER